MQIEINPTDRLYDLVRYLKREIDQGSELNNVTFDYGTIYDNKVICSLVYTYPNGNKYHQHFSISVNANNEFVLDARDTFSPYNTKYHTSFSTEEDVYNYIKDVEEWND